MPAPPETLLPDERKGWGAVVGIGLATGLALLPAGSYGLVLTWVGGGVGLLFFAAVLLALVGGSAWAVGAAGGRRAFGAVAPLVGSPWLLLAWPQPPAAGLQGWAMLLSGLLAASVAAAGIPRTRWFGRAGAALFAGLPLLALMVWFAFLTVGDFGDRAGELRRPYLLAGDYDEDYVALSFDHSSVAYRTPDGAQIGVSSYADVDDQVSEGKDLALGTCARDQGPLLSCDVTGADHELRLVVFEGDADESDLAAAVEHLRPMSTWAFYANARRYVEVFPG
ncbi:hypothetical protein GCM10009809_33470 [Isoptericola hypogeus]|uniref:Uncharacterized protein n=1 Tax=Isoptericola hypogeus TaxID=300179 RepID=A0ABP4VRE0_9MICO